MRSCVLSSSNYELDIAALFALSKLTRLQLDCGGDDDGGFNDGVLHQLCAGLPSLCALELPDGYDLSDAGVESLRALTSLRHLWVSSRLDLIDRPPPDMLPRLPYLRKLQVKGVSFLQLLRLATPTTGRPADGI